MINYYDPLEGKSVHYYGKFIKGIFVDIETGEPFPLKEGATAKIIVSDIFLKDNGILKKEEVRTVAKKGEMLQFKLYGTRLIFTIELLEDLIFISKATKYAIAEPCKMRLLKGYDDSINNNIENFEPIIVNSLNQAYFQISTRYKKQARSHAINVYRYFYLEHNPEMVLQKLRFEHE